MTSTQFLSALAIGGSLFVSTATAIAAVDQPAGPPLIPDGEALLDDPALLSGCLLLANELGEKLRSTPKTAGYFEWQLGTPMVTQNEDWGVVCRIDFTMTGEDFSPRINRLIMYKTGSRDDAMIAIGQEIAPLHSPLSPSDAYSP